MNSRNAGKGVTSGSISVRPPVLVRVLFLIAMVGLTGCSKEQPRTEAAAEDPYADWEYYTSENIRIFHPPGHLHRDRFQDICGHYVKALDQIAGELHMPPYTDTLLVYYYTGYGQGEEITGRKYPFADDTAIHFWLPSFPGPTLMQHLLPRWVKEEPRHQFLKHGLISLFDYSGQDYHASTIGYINSGGFLPLAELAVDTNINSNTERYQSAEAASFVASMLAQVGAEALRVMYESKLPFDETVDRMFGVTVDSLESVWLNFVRLNVPPGSIRDSS